MVGGKVTESTHYPRQKEAKRVRVANQKAATMTGLDLTQSPAINDGRWSDVLQTYSDYFIRY